TRRSFVDRYSEPACLVRSARHGALFRPLAAAAVEDLACAPARPRRTDARAGLWLRASRAALLPLLFLASARIAESRPFRDLVALSRLCLGCALCRLSPPRRPRRAALPLEARRDAGDDVRLGFQLDERHPAGGAPGSSLIP